LKARQNVVLRELPETSPEKIAPVGRRNVPECKKAPPFAHGFPRKLPPVLVKEGAFLLYYNRIGIDMPF